MKTNIKNTISMFTLAGTLLLLGCNPQNQEDTNANLEKQNTANKEQIKETQAIPNTSYTPRADLERFLPNLIEATKLTLSQNNNIPLEFIDLKLGNGSSLVYVFKDLRTNSPVKKEMSAEELKHNQLELCSPYFGTDFLRNLEYLQYDMMDKDGNFVNSIMVNYNICHKLALETNLTKEGKYTRDFIQNQIIVPEIQNMNSINKENSIISITDISLGATGSTLQYTYTYKEQIEEKKIAEISQNIQELAPIMCETGSYSEHIKYMDNIKFIYLNQDGNKITEYNLNSEVCSLNN
ncbi:MAG: hypothetical protein ACI4V7_02055 [Succinivibrionaceae bacterium]